MTKITCANPECDVKFKPKRANQRFHTPACRAAAARAIGVEPTTGEVLPVGAEVIAEYPNGAPKTVLVKNVEISDNPFAKKDPNYNREKNMAAFVKMGVVKVDWISTGIPAFDALTRIPRGRITQIQGPYGVGKTTLCLNMIRGLADKKVLYIDSEASLNPELLVDLELNAENFTLYNKSAVFEDIAKRLKKAVTEENYDMIIFDSLASTTTAAEVEGDITARNIGQKAFMMHKLIHMHQMDFKNKNIAFVVINQEREVIGSYVPQKYTPGGNAVPYAASLMIALKTTKGMRFPAAPKGAKKHLFLGHEVEAMIIKSKVNTPWRSAKFKLYYPDPQQQDVDADAERSTMEPF